MKLTIESLREIIREVLEEIEDEEVDESTNTTSMDGYQTPHAFSKDGETDDDYIDRLNKSTGYTRVNESQVSKTESSDLKNIISYFEKKHPEFDPWYDGMGTFTLSLDEDVNYFINIEGKTDFDIMFFDEVKNKRKSLGDGLDYRKVIKVIERFISRPEIKKVIGESNLTENTAPKNWKKLTKEKEDEQEYKNRWLELKRSEGTPNQKIGVGIRKIRRELAEMEKFVNWYSRIRSMNELDKDDYWKRTQKHLKKIKERLIGFAQKIQELDRPISESVLSESDDIVKITHGNDVWYMKRIDGTHVKSANNEKALHSGRGAVYHVRQLGNKPYYDDVRQWLYGKKDIDGNVYKESKNINEAKVTSIPDWNLESDVFIVMLEHFKNDSNFKRIVSKGGIDLLSGGNPKNIVTSMTKEFSKLFTRANVIQKIADDVNKRSLRIDVSGRDKAKLAATFAQVLAHGVMWELGEDPSHLAKMIGDKKLEKVANEFQQRRGKEKFRSMMTNIPNI